MQHEDLTKNVNLKLDGIKRAKAFFPNNSQTINKKELAQRRIKREGIVIKNQCSLKGIWIQIFCVKTSNTVA